MPEIGRQGPSSPAVRSVPGAISYKRSWNKTLMEFPGVFMKYPG